MALQEDTVREALKQVIDPELFVNIVDLGLVYQINLHPHRPEPAETEVSPTGSAVADHAADTGSTDADTGSADADGNALYDVQIEMTMTSPMCPAGPQLVAGAKAAIESIDAVRSADIKVVMYPPWTPDCMTEDARDQLGIF